MRVLVWGCSLLASAFLLQVAIWRWRVPARQVRALLLVFAGVLAPGLAAFARYAPAGRAAPAEVLLLAVFVVAVTLAYMITYSAVEVDSPSLHLVLAIRRAGPAGLPEERLLDLRSDDRLVVPRVRDLLLDRMAVQAGNRYRLTRKGRVLARTFVFYRRLLGAGKGG